MVRWVGGEGGLVVRVGWGEDGADPHVLTADDRGGHGGLPPQARAGRRPHGRVSGQGRRSVARFVRHRSCYYLMNRFCIQYNQEPKKNVLLTDRGDEKNLSNEYKRKKKEWARDRSAKRLDKQK